MPYYIYRVKPFSQLDKLAEFDAFNDASTWAKALRAEEGSAVTGKVKVMFADNEFQAEELLCQVRVAGPRGDE